MATHIKNILKQFIHKEKTKAKKTEEISQIVQQHLKATVSSEVSIGKIDKKKLTLVVSSSLVAYELNLKKQQILEEIKRHYPHIDQIQIRVG